MDKEFVKAISETSRYSGEFKFCHYRGHMDKEKEKQEISLIGRLFSLEVLLILMGLFSLVAGIIYGKMAKILAGVVIICVSLLLPFIRRKVWQKK